MQILDATKPTLLSNAEVLAHLNDLDHIYEKDSRGSQIPENLNQILRDVRSYMQIPTQPTSTKPQSSSNSKKRHPKFSPEAFPVLAQRLKNKPYRLTPAEVLGIFNHVPRSLMEVNFIVEEAEVRYKRTPGGFERVMGEILELVEKVLILGIYDDAKLDPETVTNGVNGVNGH